MGANQQAELILVVGGTGNQGGSVAGELLKHGHRVRILTRNAESTVSRQLAALGVEIVQGDLADPASLEPVMVNVSAIFSAQYADPYDPQIEPRNTANMLQAARNAGVRQVVHTSIAGTSIFPRWDQNKLLSQLWEAKYEVEQLVRKGGFRYWTILHPCWFMENFVNPTAGMMSPELSSGVLFGILGEDTPIKLNSGEDTAKFARAAFEDPITFNEQDIHVASDELSMKQIASTISEVAGKPVRYEAVSFEDAARRGLLVGTLYAMDWMEHVPGFGFDIEDTRRYGTPLKPFDQWALENKHRFEIN